MINEYRKLLKSINREGIDELLDYLDNKTEFFKMSASINGYHSNFIGGLAFHSISVWNVLNTNFKEFISGEEESFLIVSLFHDIGKIEGYKKHGFFSLELISKFIMLKSIEREMIEYHMGFYGAKLSTNKEGFKVQDYDYMTALRAMEDRRIKLFNIADDLSSNFIEEKTRKTKSDT